MSVRRPRVSWQTGQGTGKVQNNQWPGGLLAWYILYAAALSMLFLYAALRMAEDCFGPLAVTGQPGILWSLGLEILVFLGWNEILHVMRKPVLRQTGNLVLLSFILLGCWFYYGDQTGLVRGFWGLEQRYLDAWNRYFLTSLHIGRTGLGTAAKQQQAWGLLVLLAMTLLQAVSAMLRKRTLLLFLPAAVLAAEMTVGLTPEWRGMACMFAAGLLGLYLDCHREFQIIPALALAGLMGALLPLTAGGLAKPASQVSLVHDRLQAFQHQMEKSIRDYDWQALFHKEGQLDNHSPTYDRKEIMTVTVNSMPDENLYLRGYYGADYKKGSWNAVNKEFDRACRQHGVSSSEAVLLLSGLGGSARDSEGGSRLQYEIRYTGVYGNAAYLPYGADLETAKNRYRTSGDYVVEKAKSLKSFVFEGWAPDSLLLDHGKTPNSDTENFYLWYNEFARQQYLEVPEELTEVTDMVNSMEASAVCRAAQERLQEEDSSERNAARLLLGTLVAGELQSRADYNMDPGSLPRGVDPVEYFLGENRQGYCMHFATAGALLLRQLGVPARFVSGYVVQPGQFRKSASGYTASVKDEAAHAWVEIWLDQVGWVPVEMTPGYGETGISLAQQGQDAFWERQELAETLGRAEREQMLPEIADHRQADGRTAPSPLPQDLSGEKETQVVNREGNSQEAPAGTASAASGSSGGSSLQEASEGWGFAGEGGWAVFGQNGSLQVSYVIGGLLGVSAAAGLGFLIVSRLLRRRSGWWRKVREDIEGGSRGSAVRAINRRMYQRLWRKRAGMLALHTDEEYLAALKRQYPGIAAKDWERYLTVVRKAVYSQEEIGSEEAKLCYALLKHTRLE